MAKLRITQRRSAIRRVENQKRNLRALGIRKLHNPVVHNDTPQIQGMIFKIKHLVEVEEIA